MERDAGAPARLCGVHHVKLLVADVPASRDWYCRVLGFQPELDFVEDGTLMGAGLYHPGGLRLGLRCDRDRIAALAGFDLLALAVPGRAELDAWLAHLDALGVPHGPVMHGHQGDDVAVHDSDGIQIRLYTTDLPGL